MENQKLETIQKENNLNDVYRVGDEGPGGAYHEYAICKAGTQEKVMTVFYQKGPRNEEGSYSGCLDGDLLECVRDRMKSFQAGPFASEYNARVLEHVEAALQALNDRAVERANRGVLGKNEK